MLTLVVKATEACNANCVYCSVADKSSKRERMSMETLTLLLCRVRDYLESDPGRRLTLTWHGGEPALMGAQFFRAVGSLGDEVLGTTRHRVRHLVQSNITLVDDEIAHEWKSLGVQGVGTSYEYHPGLRGLGHGVDSDAYQRLFFRGVGMLQRRQLHVGVIYVVTHLSVTEPERAMAFLSNLLGQRGRGRFRFNPLYCEGEAARGAGATRCVTPEQFGHFLGKAYRYWYPRRWYLRGVGPFHGITALLETGSGALGCEDAGTCGRDHVGIGVRGEVFQCGRASDSGILSFGSLHGLGLDAVLAHALKQQLNARADRLRSGECSGCTLWNVCHGGCPVDAQIYAGDWRRRTHWCRAKEVLLGQYVLPMLGQKARGVLSSVSATTPCTGER